MTRLLLALVLLCTPATAQTFPEPLSSTVSDYANVLDPEAEARIVDLLGAAREDPGVEIAVVTIGSHRDHGAHPSLESFANGLFNAWGIGDAARDTGILILVAAEDRAVRLELGSGHAPAWDFVAEEIVHRIMRPAFASGDLPGGIEAGATAAIDRIARPVAAEVPPPPRGLSSRLRDSGPVVLFLGALAGILGLALRSVRRRPTAVCPACGTRLGASRACGTCGRTGESGGTEPTSAPHQPEATDRNNSGFGGGSSSGGGASGRW
jgi:uncharacterized protein